MAKKKAAGAAGGADEGKLFAFLGAFLPIIGFVIALLTEHKKDKYVMFYAKQGLVLGIFMIGFSIVQWILFFIPIIGWLLSSLIWLVLFVLWLIGWINALSGKEKEMPVIGQFANKFNV